VPGIADVGLDFNFSTAQLKGDSIILDQKSAIQGVKFTATYGKFSIDVNNVIYSGYTNDDGSLSSRWGMVGGVGLPYFGCRFVIADVDLGLDGIVCTIYKAQITGGTPLHSSTDNYGQPTIEIGGIQPAHLTKSPQDGGVTFVDFTPLVDIALYSNLVEPYTKLP
jgi:hypothetical protein